MARIELIELARASGKAKELLDELAARGGTPGPMVHTPALLSGLHPATPAGAAA